MRQIIIYSIKSDLKTSFPEMLTSLIVSAQLTNVYKQPVLKYVQHVLSLK